MQKKRSKEFWQELVRSYAASHGVSQRDFCKQHGVALGSFCHWWYKFGSQRAQQTPPQSQHTKTPSLVRVVVPELSAQSSAVSTQPMELALPRGAVLRFATGTDAAYVVQLATQLARAMVA